MRTHATGQHHKKNLHLINSNLTIQSKHSNVTPMVGFELVPFIKSVGYLGILISVILENGVLIFFFMPSDSLLFVAGFLASQNILSLSFVIPICFFGSVLGYMLGYYLGHKAGPALKNGKLASKYIEKEHFEKAEAMYKKHALLALIFARFFPIRAFVSFMAGATNIPYGKFMLYNIAGGALWSVSLTLVGYYFGEILAPEDLDTIFIGVFAVVIFSVAAALVFVHIGKRKAKKKAKQNS